MLLVTLLKKQIDEVYEEIGTRFFYNKLLKALDFSVIFASGMILVEDG